MSFGDVEFKGVEVGCSPRLAAQQIESNIQSTSNKSEEKSQCGWAAGLAEQDEDAMADAPFDTSNVRNQTLTMNRGKKVEVGSSISQQVGVSFTCNLNPMCGPAVYPSKFSIFNQV